MSTGLSGMFLHLLQMWISLKPFRQVVNIVLLDLVVPLTQLLDERSNELITIIQSIFFRFRLLHGFKEGVFQGSIDRFNLTVQGLQVFLDTG